MSKFYIQLQDKLLQISEELTAENISKALGYTPSSFSGKFEDLDDNPFFLYGSGEFNIVDENRNIIAKIDKNGVHSVDFIVGEHKLTEKANVTDIPSLDGLATEQWVSEQEYLTEHQDISHLATKDDVSNIDFFSLKNNPVTDEEDKLFFIDENGCIGLQLDSNGLHVKDVIADEHKLSEKANISDLSNYATKDEVSDLVDMTVVNNLSTKVNTLIKTDTNKSVREIANDELTKQLLNGNDNFQTLQELSAWINEHPEDASAMNESIQNNANAIAEIDSAYQTADAEMLLSAKTYTNSTINNINFYTIKDNPIVDGDPGAITFVDENGNIGIRFSDSELLVNDVLTPEHRLSEKADKSFVVDNYYNKSTIDKKITEAVTGGQISLDGFATEQWVTEQGYLTEHQDISHLATKDEIPTVPTKVSELDNDKGFVTLSEIPLFDEYVTETELSQKGYLTEHQDISHLATKDEIPTVPTKVSELDNDKGFITLSEVPSLDGYAKESWVTAEITKATTEGKVDLTGYATEEWVENKNYLTEHQDISHLATKGNVQNAVKNIDFYSLQNNPIVNTEDGKLLFADENGYIGLQLEGDKLYVADVVAGNHILSEKANIDDIPNLETYATKQYVNSSLNSYAKIENIPSTEGFVKSEELPNFENFVTTEELPSLDGYAKMEDLPTLDGYATHKWVYDKNYVTEYELKTIKYNSINNVPLYEDESGHFNIIDEKGNMGFKISNNGALAKDFIISTGSLSDALNRISQLETQVADLLARIQVLEGK